MHRHTAEKSHLLLIISSADARLIPAALVLAIIVAITLAVAIIAGPAAAHEDFPAEWCGGTDCRYAEPEELVVECRAIRVETADFVQSTPFSQISRWNGPRPAICARNLKLNRCNPNKGDCSAQPGLGLLLPEDAYDDLRRRAARACRDRSDEAMLRGQSVPGLKIPSTYRGASRGPTGGGGGGGGGGSSSSPPVTVSHTPEESPISEELLVSMAPLPPISLFALATTPSMSTPVPIPATLGLLALTVGALGVFARRRK
jgi:hypothetical protein